MGADPNQLAVNILDFDLAVKAAFLAVVTLGVQLGVHDVIVDELHHFQHRVDIVLHVGNFHIADGTAGGELLEIRLKLQLGESIDLLSNVYMIRVGNVALIRNTGNLAKPLLQALGKLVGGGFQRRAVEGEVDVVLCLPCGAGIIHVLHDLQSKGLCLCICMGTTGHVLYALIKTGIAQRNGRVAAKEQLVDGLALGKSCQCAVLPQNGRGVGQRALQPFVAA